MIVNMWQIKNELKKEYKWVRKWKMKTIVK